MTHLPIPPLRIVLLSLLILVISPKSNAQLPTTTLRTIWPPGGQAGTQISMVLQDGDHLDEIDRLSFSQPGIVANLESPDTSAANIFQQPRWGHFQVNLPADASEGLTDVVAVGYYGASNPRPFWISRLSTVDVLSDHSSQETAASVAVPSIVQSRCTSQAMHYYALQLDAATNLSVTSRALQLDSKANLVLVLTDDKGKELARGRGANDRDPRLETKVDATGTYYLQVYDLLYRGGNEYFYQVQLENVPLATARNATAANFPTWVSEKSSASLADQQTTLSRATEYVSGTTTELGMINQAQAVAGEFVGDPQGVAIDFRAAAGKPWMIEVLSANIGAATDPHLIVQRVHEEEKGPRVERLHEVDDIEWFPGSLLVGKSKDPVLRFVPPADGRYRLIIRDLQNASGHGIDKRFVISIREPAADFQLLAIPNHPTADVTRASIGGSQLRRGERMAIEVAVLAVEGFFEPVAAQIPIVKNQLALDYQTPWEWPITVRVDGLPASISTQEVRLDNNCRKAHLVLQASQEAETWAGPVSVVGRLEINGKAIERPATLVTVQWPDPTNRGLVPVRVCQQWWLSVNGGENAPLTIAAGDETRQARGKKGTTVDVPLTLTRSEAAKGKVTLRAAGLPADVKIDEIALEGETLTAVAKLQIGANAPVGNFYLYWNAETEAPWPRNPASLQRAESLVSQWEEQLKALQSAEGGTSDNELAALQQRLEVGRQRIEQLKETTKAQNTRLFSPSNSIQLTIEPQ